MAMLRILLANGEEITETEDGIEEVDQVRDRFKQPGKPDWVVLGDCLVFTQAVHAVQVI